MSASEIVQLVREAVLGTLKEIPEGDPWDEYEHGVNWLDNEFFLFDHFYHLLRPNANIPYWASYPSVSAIEIALDREVPAEYVRLLKRFLELGGSDNPSFFTLRDSNDLTGFLALLKA